MIHSLQVTGGYASKLPALADQQKIEFDPGLNILFGPNGCGKTTVLKIAAAYCGIDGAGWPKYAKPITARGKNKLDYAALLDENAPSKAIVEWDGQPAFFNSAVISDSMPRWFGENADGVTEGGEELQLFGRPSQGQLRIYKLNKVCKAMATPPDLLAIPTEYKSYNEVWTKMVDDFIEYVKAKREPYKSLKPRLALLWDEPDRSLSIPSQASLWGFREANTGIPIMGDRMQVIVASHSPFALCAKGARVIDMVQGYEDECRMSLKKLF